MENGEFQPESKSSVEITLNYKGEAQVKVKTYQGSTQPEMNELKDIAVNTWKTTLQELGLSWQ